MSNETLRKVIETSTIGSAGGGLLNPEQTTRFIDYMWDETVLTDGHVDAIRLNATEREIDRMHLGRRIARGATEGVDTGENAGPTFSKVTVRTNKFRLDWEITRETMEDGLEGGNIDDHIARMMAVQFGNDLEDVSINGDTSSSDPLLKEMDGYRKLAFNDGNVLTSDTPNDGLTIDDFDKALRALDRPWLQRRGDFRFYTSAGLVHSFVASLRDRETALGDEYFYDARGRQLDNKGAVNIRPLGMPLVEVPLMSERYALDGDDPDEVTDGTGYGYVELTIPDNRIWATKREIEVFRQFAQKKDTFEYTVYVRHGVQWKNLSAGANSATAGGPYVAIKNIKATPTA